ncbi:unnamed protein product, partial [Effrenium voratum]
ARAAEHGVPCRRRPGLCSRSSWAEGQHVGKTAPVACRSRSARRGCARGQQWPGLGDTCIGLERWACWLSGPARSRGGGGPSEKATSQPCLAQVVAEAKRVVDNGTLKDMQVVMRKVQLTDPGKWNDLATKPELKQQLKKFVAEAALKALEEDLLLARQQQASAQRQVETAQRQVESAQRQVESAQRQVESAQEQEAMAVRRLARAATVLETAEDSGNATKVQEAKEEVQEAKKEVREAKKEVQEAEVKEAKASGRTKESEAGGVGRFRRPAAFWDSDRCVRF